MPGEVWFRPDPGAADQRVELIYTGAEVLMPRGRKIPAGTPVPFSFERFVPPVKWSTRWYQFSEPSDPLTAPDAFRKALEGPPVLTEARAHLDYISGRSLREKLPGDRIALVAEGRVTLPPGAAATSKT